MRLKLAIPLLVLWLLAPSGGIGLALHGLEHKVAETSSSEGEPSCGSCCPHSTPQPTEDTTPEPAPDEAPCSLCELLTTAAPLVLEWNGPPPVEPLALIALVEVVDEGVVSRHAVAARSRGPPTA